MEFLRTAVLPEQESEAMEFPFGSGELANAINEWLDDKGLTIVPESFVDGVDDVEEYEIDPEDAAEILSRAQEEQ